MHTHHRLNGGVVVVEGKQFVPLLVRRIVGGMETADFHGRSAKNSMLAAAAVVATTAVGAGRFDGMVPETKIEAPQISPRIKSGRVAIPPLGLQGVAADHLQAFQLETGLGPVDMWFFNPAENIGFTPARGTRTELAEDVEGEITFRAILPDQRQFLTDLLDGTRGGLHTYSLAGGGTPATGNRQVSTDG